MIFTHLNLRCVYNLIRIKEGDEYKTAFCTRCGQFEYRVMPVGLMNSLGTFQACIDECPTSYLDDFVVCYLYDILIYSHTVEDHKEHVKQVLAKLRKLGLFCTAEKCVFSARVVRFLGFVFSLDGVGMNDDCAATIEVWATPKAVRVVQVLLGFTNFYRQFIRKYAKATVPISNLLRGRET